MTPVNFFYICLFKIGAQSVSSVTQSCLTLCDPMDCSTPGFSVLHHLPEFAQTRVHWVSDAIQPSHPLLSPSPPNFNLSQHQGLFQWVGSSHQLAKVLEFQLQLSVFPMNIQNWFPLGWTSGSPCCPGDSQESSCPTPQFKNISSFSTQLSLWSNSHIHTWLLEKPELWLDGPSLVKYYLCFLICCLGWS